VAVIGRAALHGVGGEWFSEAADTQFLAGALAPLGVRVSYAAIVRSRPWVVPGYGARLPESWDVVPLVIFSHTRSRAGAWELARAVRDSMRASRGARVVVIMLPSPVTLVCLVLGRLRGQRTVAYWGVTLEGMVSIWVPRLSQTSVPARVLAGAAMRMATVNLVRRPSRGGDVIAGPSKHLAALRRRATEPRSAAPGGPRVGFVGFRDRRKGFDRFVQVAALLEGPEGQRPTLVMAGRNPGTGRIRTYPEGCQVDDRGYVSDSDEYADLLAGLDVLLLPSRVEGRARVVEEALVVGTPAVVSGDAGFAPGELPGVDVLSDPDPAAWARALAWLFDPDERRRRSELAVEGGAAFEAAYVPPETTLGEAVRRLL
jgi:glycosyltransferase involved in cell wall biosynthesis